MTKDFRVTVKVRNNLLLAKMEACGIPSLAELARQSGLKDNDVSLIATMRRAARNKLTGEWHGAVLKIATTLKCLPEDIVPEAVRGSPMAKREASFTVNAGDAAALGASLRTLALPPSVARERADLRALIGVMLDALPEREKHILRNRYGFDGDKTYDELANELGISKERVRQIESKALRRLKEPNVKSMLKQYSGTDSHEELIGAVSEIE